MTVVSDKWDDQLPEHDPSSAMEKHKILSVVLLGYLGWEVVVLGLPILSSY